MSQRRTVSHEETFDLPAAAVWDLLVDWPSIADWMPDGIIASVTAEGRGVGAVRNIVTYKGVHIAERLERADARSGQLELSILEPLPWGMRSYVARAQLDALGTARCRLSWEGRFELPRDSGAADELAKTLLWSYRAMFAGIRQHLVNLRN